MNLCKGEMVLETILANVVVLINVEDILTLLSYIHIFSHCYHTFTFTCSNVTLFLLIGCLIYELFSGLKLGKTEELRNTASIPKVSILI